MIGFADDPNSPKAPSTMRPPERVTTICLVLLVWCCPLLAQDGATLCKKHGAACHDQVSPRIPPRSALQKMPGSRILRTMDFGLMMSIAYPLRREEREAIANVLGTKLKSRRSRPVLFVRRRSLSCQVGPLGIGQAGVQPFPTRAFNPQRWHDSIRLRFRPSS